MSRRAEILHASPWQGVFYITGGGSLLLSEMLTTAGASGTVLEARVPYTTAALAEILGRQPEQACSDSTARAMAMAAFQRARALCGSDHAVAISDDAGGSDHPVAIRVGESRPGGRSHRGGDLDAAFGLACTASLATGRVKRGRHRAHVALQTAALTYTAHLELDAEREEEERQLLELLWHALAEALELELPVTPPANPVVAHTPAQHHWRSLVLGEELAYATAPHDGRLLMPGAFNPLHHAHEAMLAIAEQKTGLAGAYELSIVNVDKPFLDYTEIDTRLRQFSRPVWVTRLPTFFEKARHFPGAHFAVGIDTLTRIAEPAYYGGAEPRDRALAELADLGTRLVVFGRRLEEHFVSLSDVSVPDALGRLCIEVTQAEFDEPVSSTQIRRGR